MRNTDVSVVIVAGGARPDIDECLLSLSESTYTPREILVVDNSPEGLGETFSVAFPRANIVQPKRRLTFAEAANFGMRMAVSRGARAVLLLNDDVTVHAQALSILAEAQRAHGPGIFAPEIWPYESTRSRTRFAIDWEKRLITRVPVAVNGRFTPIDYAEGSAVLVSAVVMGRIGLFDEKFGFYYEDADFSIRAKDAGFPVVEVEGARVWHKGSVSAGVGLSPFKAYYRVRNTVLFALKHRRRAHVTKVTAYHFWAFVLPAALRCAARAALGSKAHAETLAAMVRGTIDLLTGGGKIYLPRRLPDITEQIARLTLPRQAC